jgi:hypothetical protein
MACSHSKGAFTLGVRDFVGFLPDTMTRNFIIIIIIIIRYCHVAEVAIIHKMI